MGAAVVGLFLIGAVVLWISAGVKFYRGGALPKLLGQLGLCAVVIFALWFFIVAPTLDCAGFLCGIDALVLFIILSYVTILAWGLVLFFYANKKFHNSNRKAEESTDLLDDNF